MHDDGGVPTPHDIIRFIELLQQAIADGSFKRAVLAKPRKSDEATRIAVREVMVRDAVMLSFVYSYPTKDITKNLPVADGIALLQDLIGSTFQRAHLVGRTENVDLSVSKKGAATLHRSAVAVDVADVEAEVAAPVHDRAKNRYVQQDRTYLRELGVTDSSARVVPSMAKKWKQINKFVEIVDAAIKESALNKVANVEVTDFGSGKGYLTFALHDHLQTTLGKTVKTRGVELREDLVGECNLAARHSNLNGLTFVAGDIETDDPSVVIDIMVALHACDTATDLAIARGIRANASIIVCSPCCHKELRPQLQSPPAMTPLLRHGVHLGVEAEMITDTLRALILEQHGYDTKIFEFVGLEHSSKNKMILGVKRSNPNAERAAKATAEIAELKAFYGITSQHLENDLQNSRS